MKLDVPGSQFWASSLSTSRSGSNKANDVGTQPQFRWCHLVIQRSGPLDTATGPVLTIAYHHRCAHILADYAISFPPFCRNIYITIFHPPQEIQNTIFTYIYILIYIHIGIVTHYFSGTWANLVPFPAPHWDNSSTNNLTTMVVESLRSVVIRPIVLGIPKRKHHINPYPKFIERIGKEKPQTTKITQEVLRMSRPYGNPT
jgi:hypothetical protein